MGPTIDARRCPQTKGFTSRAVGCCGRTPAPSDAGWAPETQYTSDHWVVNTQVPRTSVLCRKQAKPVAVKTRGTLWAQRGKMEEPLTKQSCSEPQPVALSRPPVACSPARPGWAHSACRRSRCTRTGVPADPRRAGPASRSRARSPARSAAIVTLHNLAKSVKRQLTVLAYICKMPSCKHCRAPFSRRSSVL